MAISLEVESTLTDRYQTTVPETVRRALKLGKRDKIHYSILPDGAVLLSRADTTPHEDPALEPFLKLLAADITRHPERLRVVDQAVVERLQAATRGVEFDLDAPLAAEDE